MYTFSSVKLVSAGSSLPSFKLSPQRSGALLAELVWALRISLLLLYQSLINSLLEIKILTGHAMEIRVTAEQSHRSTRETGFACEINSQLFPVWITIPHVFYVEY